MLIGVDMIGVQSPGACDREAGRYGRQLVRALLARDPVNRYVLYLHEGLPSDMIPSASNAVRVSLASASGRANSRRASTQHLLDRDPHGLDWLILLDPFAASYGGLPPEAPLNGPRVASVVHDLESSLDQGRRLIPLRRHDTLLAVSPEVASAYASMMGVVGPHVSMIGLASDETFTAPPSTEPLTRSAGVELGRLGIHGPFVLTRMSGSPSRADLDAAFEPYRRLPVELRRVVQLVVTGSVRDPAPVRRFLREHGAEEGLVLAGEVSESTLATLYGRCSAFLAPAVEGGRSLMLVEAMKCGAPVIGVHSPSRFEILGDAGRLVEPSDLSQLADACEDVLSDARLANDLRLRSLGRSARFSFDAVVHALVASLDGATAPTSTRFRSDRGHGVRPRIAVFLDVEPDPSGRLDLESSLPVEWLESYAIDLYLEPRLSALADGLSTEFGGFDARLFDRNDAILGYRAVVYLLGGASRIVDNLDRLARRPGLVALGDDAWLDRPGSIAPGCGPEDAVARLRDLFKTGSRAVVRSPRLADRIARCLPDFVDQLVEIPPSESPVPRSESLRLVARSRLDILPEILVIGLFGRWEASTDPGRISRALEAVSRAIPDATFLSFDSDLADVGERFFPIGPLSPEEARIVIPVLDLAIHLDGSESSTIPGLLGAGIPTIAVDADPADPPDREIAPSDVDELRQLVVGLASDPDARSTHFQATHAECFGTPDPSKASRLLLEQVERWVAEPRRGPGRTLRKAEGTRGLKYSPHFPRAASATGEAASRSR